MNLQMLARCAAVLLVAGVAAAGDDPAVAAPLPDLVPRGALLSSDNAFEVSAVQERMGVRGPVLFFAGQFRREFLRATHLVPGRVDYPISIHLGSSTSDVSVAGSFTRGLTGVEREWVEMPDPQHADLDLLRTVLAQAMAREWRRSLTVAPDAKPPQDPPAWLFAGLARHLGAAHRMEDLDLVHAQWQRGRLPALAELLASEPPVALQHPALQAVLVAWLLDRPGEPIAGVMHRLAGGTPWSPALVAGVLQARNSLTALGEEWDAWQVNAMREVRQVGVTTPGMVQAFSSQLLLYPADCGLAIAEPWRGRTLGECLGWPLTPELREALAAKAVVVRNAAAGRDGALQGVARAYESFLEAVAAGEAADKLRRMLAQAEAARLQLEARAARGELLHDPVVEALPAHLGCR